MASVLCLSAPTAACASYADVDAFVAKREQCDHFRGEEPYDKARARYLARQMKRYCAGTDKELARLKGRYAADDGTIEKLSRYEDRIE